MRTYNLFISHSWHYEDSYTQLIELLDNASYFDYRNFSVPKDNSIKIHNSRYYETELRNKIAEKMKPCSVILILAGVYATYSKYINIEIEVAKELGKSIIAIEPWGSERTSLTVKINSNKIVKWNTNSIVNAIKEVCLI